MMLVVRSFRHKWRGKLKKVNNSGKSFSSCLTTSAVRHIELHLFKVAAPYSAASRNNWD
jgi:hypothetical protein